MLHYAIERYAMLCYATLTVPGDLNDVPALRSGHVATLCYGMLCYAMYAMLCYVMVRYAVLW